MFPGFELRDTNLSLLNINEQERSRDVFTSLDREKTGFIDKEKLLRALDLMDNNLSKEERHRLLIYTDNTNRGLYDYSNFLKVLADEKMRQSINNENDYIDAFVAIGGNEDRTGKVDVKRLIEVIKGEFGMTIDIEKLIKEIDLDGSGEIEYNEFRALLSN